MMRIMEQNEGGSGGALRLGKAAKHLQTQLAHCSSRCLSWWVDSTAIDPVAPWMAMVVVGPSNLSRNIGQKSFLSFLG